MTKKRSLVTLTGVDGDHAYVVFDITPEIVPDPDGPLYHAWRGHVRSKLKLVENVGDVDTDVEFKRREKPGWSPPRYTVDVFLVMRVPSISTAAELTSFCAILRDMVILPKEWTE